MKKVMLLPVALFLFLIPLALGAQYVNVTPVSPLNGAVLNYDDITVNVSIYAEGTNFTNITFKVWNSAGSLYSNITSNVTGNGTKYVDLLYYNLNEDETYTWNAKIVGVNSSGTVFTQQGINQTFKVNVLPDAGQRYGTTYTIFESVGAGIGTFTDFMGQTLPSLIITLALVSGAVLIVLVVSRAIKNAIMRK